MRRIWAYQGDLGWGKDFKWMSIAEFNRTFTVGKAIGFLAQIKKTLQQEARDLPKEGDFYTGIRHAFAEVDGLGKLYCGERGKDNSAQNSIDFAKEYLGRVNCRYGQLFGLLVDMYRHGLAHTHLTKSVKFRGNRRRWVTLGWVITDTDSHRARHLTVQWREASFFSLWLHVPQLVDDVLLAIDAFSSDLRKRGHRSWLFSRFKQGYIGTAAVFEEPVPPSASGAPRRKRKLRNRLILSQYSAPGIALVRSEVIAGNAWKE